MSLTRIPLLLVAALTAVVVVATGNLTGLGIGETTLLYDPIALPRLAAAVVLASAAWLVWSLAARKSGFEVRTDVVLGLLGGLAAWAVVSALVSDNRMLALLGQSERMEGIVTFAMYALVYGLALQVVRRGPDVRLVLTAFSVACIVVAVHGILQYVGIDTFDYTVENYSFELRRAFSTFGNPNFLAGLLVLAFPVVSTLALTGETRLRQMLWGLGALAVGVALFATFTRGAWIATAIEVLIGARVLARKRVPSLPATRRAGFVLICVILLVVALSLGATGELNPLRRLDDLTQPGGSVSERMLTAEVAWTAALSRPIVGYGPDAFLPAFRLNRSERYLDTVGSVRTINNAHSWPLQLAATLGFPGAALLLSVLVTALWRSRRFLAVGKKDSPVPTQLLMSSVWAACAGFAVHMLFNVAVPGSSLSFFVLLGILGAPSATVRQRDEPLSLTVVLAVALVAVVASTASLTLVLADATYLSSRSAVRRGDYDLAARLGVRARGLNPISVKYARGVAEIAKDRVTMTIAAQGQPDKVRTLYDAANAEYRRVLRHSPNDYAALTQYAAVTGVTGRYLEDRTLLSRAQSLARNASRLDRQHIEIVPMLRGDFSPDSIDLSAQVPRLP